MSKVLVTGGAGFIGSHLCERLLREGHEVTAVDNLATGSMENLQHLEGNACFKFVNQDITRGLPDVPASLVFNMACRASPIHYQRAPVETLQVCSVGMENVLMFSKEKGARLVQASTSEVYGDPLEHPQKETYWGHVNSYGPRSCYDEGKRFAEALCYSHRQVFGTDVRLARIFNTYGPRMALNDGRVVPAFVSQALRGEPLTVFGDGSQSRSFCFVSDLVEGLIRLGQKEGLSGEVVNLGNPHEFTMLEFAQAVQKEVGSALPLVHKPLPGDDPRQRQPDISKAKALLGWEPRVQLEEGLRETVAYFKSRV